MTPTERAQAVLDLVGMGSGDLSPAHRAFLRDALKLDESEIRASRVCSAPIANWGALGLSPQRRRQVTSVLLFPSADSVAPPRWPAAPVVRLFPPVEELAGRDSRVGADPRRPPSGRRRSARGDSASPSRRGTWTGRAIASSRRAGGWTTTAKIRASCLGTGTTCPQLRAARISRLRAADSSPTPSSRRRASIRSRTPSAAYCRRALVAASVGFQPVEGRPNRDGGTDWSAQILREWSVVNVPALGQAEIARCAAAVDGAAITKWLGAEAEPVLVVTDDEDDRVVVEAGAITGAVRTVRERQVRGLLGRGDEPIVFVFEDDEVDTEEMFLVDPEAVRAAVASVVAARARNLQLMVDREVQRQVAYLRGRVD